MVRSWFLVFIILLIALLGAYYNYFLIGLFLFIAVIIYLFINKRTAPDLLVLALIGLAGLIFFNLSLRVVPASLPDYDEYTLTGYVANFTSYNGERGSFILKTEDQSYYRQKVQVFSNFDHQLKKGDFITIQGKLTVPEPPGNPGEFDYKTYLARERIYYIFNLKEADDLAILSQDTNILTKLNHNYREKLEMLADDIMGEEAAAILLGMMIGKIDGIDPNEYEDFQKTGIVHVFSVSGLHVGFLLIFCHIIISFLNLSSRTKLYASLIVLVIYGTLVGWPITVIRASIMGALGALALYVKRDRSLLDSLGLAGLVIVIMDPYAPFKIGFQLSFAATWGLVYLYPLWKDFLTTKNKVTDYILIPLCAQIPIIPFIAYHFNLFSPISIISNIVLGYILGLIVMLGFAAMTVILFSPVLFAIIALPAAVLIELVQTINSWLVNVPLAYIHVATPDLLVIFIYFGGLALIVLYGHKRVNCWAFRGGLLLLVSFIVIIHLPAGIYNKGKLEIVMIDVGQGESILLKSPQGKFILIDGGGSEFSDVGKRKVLAYLKHRGIRKLYLTVNTHPDTDHLQGMETVLAEVAVKNIGVPAILKDASEYQLLKIIAHRQKAVFIPLSKGQIITIEPDFTMQVIHPDLSYDVNSANDQSVVLLAKYQHFSILLTGDIEREGLEHMLARHNLSPVTILKIPHHGSRNSLVPELYEKTSPKFGLISAGRNNNYGHPHTEILEALEAKGATPLRTDQGGLIHIESDGISLKIKRPMMKD